MLGPGWNIPADAVYPVSEKSADGKDYDGNNKYVLRFEKGQMPPVNDRGFWSLTMYDGNRFFVPNALNRYTLSQRDQFIANADGSVRHLSRGSSAEPRSPHGGPVKTLQVKHQGVDRELSYSPSSIALIERGLYGLPRSPRIY